MKSQVDKAEDKIKEFKIEGSRNKKVLGMDINKVEVILDRLKMKKL